MGKTGKFFQLKPRIKDPNDPMNIKIKADIPGPGKYGAGIELNKVGVYPISTIQNSKAAAWSPSKKRFPEINKHLSEVPGPGQYD